MAASCNGVETSIDFHCSDNDTDGVSAILMYIINFMGIGVGIAVVIGIIFGGITYAMSDGEESKAKEGREIISNSIIGLFLFLFLYAGANFLIPGGAFNLNAKPKEVATSSTSSGTQATPDTSTVGSTTAEKTAALKALKSNGKIANLRDAGASGYIKTGVLYRSANLNNVSSDDKKQLAILLKSGVIIDLRKTSDPGYVSDPSLNGVSNELDSIKGESSAAGYATTFVDSAAAREEFASAMNTIASSDGPVLVHCKQGKDRTGWLIALTMMAVGVSKSSALSEYLKSPDVSASWFNAAYQEALSKSHSSNGTILGYITNSVNNGGLGISQSTLDALKKKLKA